MRRPSSLTVQLVALQMVIVLAVLLAAGWLAVRLQQEQVRGAYEQRVLALARGLAGQEAVAEAYASEEPARALQPLAELVRTSAGAVFVVFTDAEGIRYSHPDPEKIGLPVSTDPSVALGGEEFVGTETGTLGRSLRAKVPVRDASGAVVGQVSVGILESELDAAAADLMPQLVAWLTGAAFLGVLGAVLVTRVVRRRIHGLEPEEIAELLQARDAMLHGIREGVVAVDDRGRVVLVNDEARRLLGLDDEPSRRPVEEVLETEDLLALAREPDDVHDRVALVGERVLVVNATDARVGRRVVGRVLVLRDRTELFDALRALDGQRTITDALRAQAHEFSNTLHVLSGLIGLGRHQEAISFIERVGGGSTTVVGGSVREVEDSALAALLVAKAAAAREKGIAMRLDPDSAVDEGVGDDVVTIVANLVDNALDATGHGGTVEVLLQHRVGSGVVVEVRDDGPGVPPELRQQIFETGVTTKAGPDSDGSQGAHGRGIGLALVSRIVTRRGGEVAVHDRPEGGAAFVVRLPAAPVPAGAVEEVR